MCFVTELVRATLHDGEIVFVSCQRCEALRALVGCADVCSVREPGFLRHPKPTTQENGPLGRNRGGPGGRGGEPTETDGFQGRQRDESSSPAEEVTAIELRVHGRFQDSRLDQFMNGHGARRWAMAIIDPRAVAAISFSPSATHHQRLSHALGFAFRACFQIAVDGC